MNNQIPLGTTIESNIIGPIKTVKIYAKTKAALKKYEIKSGVIKFHDLKRETYKNNGENTDINQKISNPLIKLLKRNSADTTDVYKDKSGNPVLSCSYQLQQGLINKKAKIICNCINTQTKSHQAYYYLSLCIKYNISTSEVESMLNRLLSITG